MKKDDLVFIEHILESIELIEEYAKGISEKEFLGNKKLQDAIIRRIEVIGEAAKNISFSFRNEYPKIQWQQMIGTRDKLTHHYFGVDLELTFKIIKKDLPELKEQIQNILDKKE